LHDDGFRNFSPSDIRRFYSDVGYRSENAEFHLNVGLADNKFGATATVPIELLEKFWGATYTTPQTTANQVAYANLTSKVEVTPTWTFESVAHVRAFGQQIVDGNPTGAQPCEPMRHCSALAMAARRRTASMACSFRTRSRRARSWESSTAP
jgi:hypothetical protein